MLTIIVPVYNHQDFIGDCLESIINQDYPHWEAIIVNDGSNDDSLAVINKYIKSDNRFILINQPNKGIYKLHEIYNSALKISKGEYIAVLEGDDYWPLNKLSKQIKSFVNDRIGLSWGDGIYVDKSGKEIKKIDKQESKWGQSIVKNNPVGSSSKYFLFASNFFNIPTCSVMFRKKALNNIGGFWQPENLKWLDRPTWLLISLKYEFAYCNFNTGFWRRHSDQITSSNTDYNSSLDYMIKSSKHIKEELNHIFQEKYVEIKCQLYLTKIYREVSITNFYNHKNLFLNFLFLLCLNPLRILKHTNFLYKVKKIS